MEYLLEQEVGFAPPGDRIGFPSVDGCLALGFLTETHLFGSHNLGGNSLEARQERAGLFREYVTGHGGGRGLHLFGCTQSRGHDPTIHPRIIKGT